MLLVRVEKRETTQQEGDGVSHALWQKPGLPVRQLDGCLGESVLLSLEAQRGVQIRLSFCPDTPADAPRWAHGPRVTAVLGWALGPVPAINL